MTKIPPLMMKPAMPVSLMELLAIPLSNLKTIAKRLVITPALSRMRGERSEGGGAGIRIRYASPMLSIPT
jgi:hypothetical protein